MDVISPRTEAEKRFSKIGTDENLTIDEKQLLSLDIPHEGSAYQIRAGEECLSEDEALAYIITIE